MLMVYMTMLLIAMILPMVNYILSPYLKQNREKSSPFECGFDPSDLARLPFSLRFYMIAVIFLMFDIEMTLILPLPIMNFASANTINTLLMLIFILILLMGLILEWKNGALNWKN